MLEARRRYLWINEKLHRLGAAEVAKIDHAAKQSDLASIAELDAFARMLARVGVSPDPPEGWSPADASLMRLPEENARLGQGQ